MYIPHARHIADRFSHYTTVQRWAITIGLGLLVTMLSVQIIKKLDATIAYYEQCSREAHESQLTMVKAQKELPYLKQHITHLKKAEDILYHSHDMVITQILSVIDPQHLISIEGNGYTEKNWYKKVGVELKFLGSLKMFCDAMAAMSDIFCCAATHISLARTENQFEVLSSWSVYLV